MSFPLAASPSHKQRSIIRFGTQPRLSSFEMILLWDTMTRHQPTWIIIYSQGTPFSKSASSACFIATPFFMLTALRMRSWRSCVVVLFRKEWDTWSLVNVSKVNLGKSRKWSVWSYFLWGTQECALFVVMKMRLMKMGRLERRAAKIRVRPASRSLGRSTTDVETGTFLK